MTVLFVVLALVVLGLAVALALGGIPRLSVHSPAATSSAGGRPLPEDEFFSDDVAGVRFDTAVRGYRMDQVDAALDRLRERLAELEDEIAGIPGPSRPGGVEDAGEGSHSDIDDIASLREAGGISAFPAVRPPTRGYRDDAGERSS